MQTKKKVEEENRVYERDRDLIYISGFEKHIPNQTIQEFLQQFGEISHFEYYDGRKDNMGGR